VPVSKLILFDHYTNFTEIISKSNEV